ncbi:MAG: hypothetical protein P4L66_08105 [Acetobacteraceae bacterium]|nr:hypothetical protein [Acetobacteraceae bacterium]
MNAHLASALTPIYPLAYAAQLAGLDSATARRWVKGHAYNYKGERRQAAPVIHIVRPGAPINGDLSFEELLTLRLVRAFRDKGLGLPTIKKAAQIAADKYGQSNPFVTKAFRSDGVSVFLELGKQAAVGNERLLVNALTGQQEFRDVVEPSLFRDLVFVGDTPGQWFPLGLEHSVVIRPDQAFGSPHLKETGIRTDVVADAVIAEGADDAAVKAVAAWFNITEQQVRDAVEAERAWHLKAA